MQAKKYSYSCQTPAATAAKAAAAAAATSSASPAAAFRATADPRGGGVRVSRRLGRGRALLPRSGAVLLPDLAPLKLYVAVQAARQFTPHSPSLAPACPILKARRAAEEHRQRDTPRGL